MTAVLFAAAFTTAYLTVRLHHANQTVNAALAELDYRDRRDRRDLIGRRERETWHDVEVLVQLETQLQEEAR